MIVRIPHWLGALACLIIGAAASVTVAEEVTVFSDAAEIKDSKGAVLARPDWGQRLPLVRIQGNWRQIDFRDGDRTIRGWIHVGHLHPPDLTDEQRARISVAVRQWDEGELHADRAARIAVHEESLAVFRECLGDGWVFVADLMLRLANDCAQSGDYGRTDPLFRRALKTYAEVLGKEHPRYADVLNDWGITADQMGDHPRAIDMHRQAAEIRRRADGPESNAYAGSLDALATACAQIGDDSQAEALFRQSLTIREKLHGKAHPLYAESLNNLAIVRSHQGDLNEAEALLKQSLEILRAVYGERDKHVASTLDNLAGLYDGGDEHPKAEALYRQVIDIRLEVLGDTHPEYADSVRKLAQFLAAGQAFEEATQLFDQERRATRRQVARVLPGMSEKTQLTYLANNLARSPGRGVSLCLSRPDDTAIATAAAEWVLNTKAVAHEALSMRAIMARQSDDPEVAPLVEQLRECQRQLAALTLRGVDPENSRNHRVLLRQLTDSEEDLSRQLVDRTGRQARLPEWIPLDEVRACLAADTTLVEIMHYPSIDYAAYEDRPARYGAWIIPSAGAGDVSFVDLGEAAVIDQAVVAARRAIVESAALIADQGEELAVRDSQATLRQFAVLTLDPILARLAEGHALVLSPDASLWLAPWAALPTEDGRMLIERAALRYVVTGRDLLRASADAQGNESLVLADPDYDLAGTDAPAGASSLNSGDRAKRSPTRSWGGLGAMRFGRLPATRIEAHSVAPSLQAMTGKAPRLLLGADASEEAARQVARPRVLSLSTHGFFLPDQNTDGDPTATVAQTTAPASENTARSAPTPLENPLLRCGLAFAGANTRGQRTDDTTDDGILTGLEIVGMDLRGTELVVLSACETGLGDVRNGEGVAGLRQAFQMAGAEAVVATLWQIPDKDTAIIMGDFFANLAAGQTKAEALRNAQLKRIADRRERNGAAHPLFWAAFTLTGNGN